MQDSNARATGPRTTGRCARRIGCDSLRGPGPVCRVGVHPRRGRGRAGGAERARRVTAATRASPAWQAVDAAWDRLLEGLREAETALRWFASAVDEVDDVAVADLAEAGERQELLLSDLANTIRIGTELAGKFASALDAPEAGRVFWLERTRGDRSHRVSLGSARRERTAAGAAVQETAGRPC